LEAFQIAIMKPSVFTSSKSTEVFEMRKLFVCFALAVFATLIAPGICTAMSPIWLYPMDYEVLESQAIVVGRITGKDVPPPEYPHEGRLGKNTVVVDKVFLGSFKVGDVITIDILPELPGQVYEHPGEYGTYKRLPDGTLKRLDKPEIGTSVADSPIVLFLYMKGDTFTSRSTHHDWSICGYASGVRWIVNGRVYGYQELGNTFPLLLFPYKEAATADDLYYLINSEINNRDAYYAVLGTKDKTQKIAGLRKYLGPKISDIYFYEATKQLLTMGEAGKQALREEAKRSDQIKWHAIDIANALKDGRANPPIYLPGLERKSDTPK
jgi:hypothetical protein